MFPKHLYVFIVAALFQVTTSSIAIATVQERDLIVYEGARYYPELLPPLSEFLAGMKLPDFLMLSTANSRGYRATWAVIDKQLFLIGIEGRVHQNDGRRMLSNQELFPGLIFPHKVNTFSGEIILNGRPFNDYEIVGDDVITTKKILLQFTQGNVVNIVRDTINEREIARKKGQALLEMSTFKRAFEAYFSFTNIEADEKKLSSVFFQEPEWRAVLIPQKSYAYPSEVSAVFPITKPNTVSVTLTPQEVDDILEKAVTHPFIVHRFTTGNATGIRLRITGDRLHWNTTELQTLLKKIKEVEASDNELRHWGNFIIDTKAPLLTSLYLNGKTGELIVNGLFGPRLISDKEQKIKN